MPVMYDFNRDVRVSAIDRGYELVNEITRWTLKNCVRTNGIVASMELTTTFVIYMDRRLSKRVRAPSKDLRKNLSSSDGTAGQARLPTVY
jgi:hypothetical protein